MSQRLPPGANGEHAASGAPPPLGERALAAALAGGLDVAPPVTLLDLWRPVRRGWRLLLVFALGLPVLVVAALLLRRPRYSASVALATVTSTPGFSLGGAAALLAGGAGLPTGGMNGGFQVSPALVSSLLESRRVLFEVGTSTAPDGRSRIVDVVAERQVPPSEVARELGKIVSTGVSKETGLVSLEVTSPDSGLARVIAERVVDATTRAYVATARAQASQLRQAHQVRVDTATQRLARAQRRYQAFLSANRALEDFSAARIQGEDLQREVALTTEVYTKAVGDREAAVAKELEQTPVVVAVDPLPAEIPRKPRYLALFAPLAAIAGLLLGLFVVFVRDAIARERARAAGALAPHVPDASAGAEPTIPGRTPPAALAGGGRS